MSIENSKIKTMGDIKSIKIVTILCKLSNNIYLHYCIIMSSNRFEYYDTKGLT